MSTRGQKDAYIATHNLTDNYRTSHTVRENNIYLNTKICFNNDLFIHQNTLYIPRKCDYWE